MFVEKANLQILKGNALAFPFCDPGGIQTHDFRNRNPAFYSAELRGLLLFIAMQK